MEKIRASGKARSIGVSNFSTDSLQAILDSCTVKPVINQVEFHPYALPHYLPSLLPLCQEHAILIGAYSSLLSLTRYTGRPVDDAVRQVVRERARGETQGQILLLWAQQVTGGVVVT